MHVDFAQARDAPRELEERLDAFEDTHVGEADFLKNVNPDTTLVRRHTYLYELEFGKVQSIQGCYFWK